MDAPLAKLILVHRVPVPGLEEHLSALRALPRRALSTPLAELARPPVAAFVELWGPIEALRSAFEAWPAPGSAWLVDERRPADSPRTWPSGEPSPGVRLVGSVFRRAELDRAAFARSWHGPHTEVALAFTIPVWRYGQNVVREAWGADEGEDGFAVLHFRAPAELADRWARYPDEARRGAEDAARFMDASRGWNVVMTETLWEETGAGP
ncbi:MAG: hypothetical protein IPK00_04750 [Deltaproteobacteria bacterium]|nr:hypothetical protein [Deltaproteobacteria bacterium]